VYNCALIDFAMMDDWELEEVESVDPGWLRKKKVSKREAKETRPALWWKKTRIW
jgi:hypothetical protein